MNTMDCTCKWCGVSFVAPRKRRFCSEKCRQAAPRRYADCKWCGKTFGINQRKSKKIEHCSVQCRTNTLEAQRIRKAEERKLPRSLVYFIGCACCSKRICVKSKATQYCFDCAAQQAIAKRRKQAEKSCMFCGVVFSQLALNRQALCSDTCKEQLDKERQSNRRAWKYRDKARRRALLQHGDKFDPFEIFSRDGWRCCLCGCDTPQSKRGTNDDDAPELDHIFPLAYGGKHSRDNTQLLCRKCNNVKGDKVFDSHIGGGGVRGYL